MTPTSAFSGPQLAWAVAFFSACTDLSEYDRERVRDAMADSLLSVTESRNIRMELIEDGQRIVAVSAPFAATYNREGRSETDLRDSVYVAVFDTTAAIETEVTSRSARYLGTPVGIPFQRRCHRRTRDGRSGFSTDYLEWSQSDRTIYTPDFVIIVTEADSITGYGLTGTDDLVSYRLTEVTGRI
jgi:hypothetical protein